MDYEIKASFDEASMGSTRDHFVFPAIPAKPYEKATIPSITGGVYIRKDTPIPDRIIIVLNR
jgi:hypothetical protein